MFHVKIGSIPSGWEKTCFHLRIGKTNLRARFKIFVCLKVNFQSYFISWW